MTTPFDEVIEQIGRRGFHNQRLEDHSDIVSSGILVDLRQRCDSVAVDFSTDTIRAWKNVRTPGARKPEDRFTGRTARRCQRTRPRQAPVLRGKQVGHHCASQPLCAVRRPERSLAGAS